jgi:hypothetical protein
MIPGRGSRRITLNRPEKRNALNNRLRAEVFEVLEQADRDGDISISIVRGGGPCFSAGFDLSADNRVDQPYHSAAGPGQWSRHVVEGWFGIWTWQSPWSRKCMAIASPAAPNSLPPAISSMSPTTRRSAIRRCG